VTASLSGPSSSPFCFSILNSDAPVSNSSLYDPSLDSEFLPYVRSSSGVLFDWKNGASSKGSAAVQPVLNSPKKNIKKIIKKD
jgi:hypothetical protein